MIAPAIVDADNLNHFIGHSKGDYGTSTEAYGAQARSNVVASTTNHGEVHQRVAPVHQRRHVGLGSVGEA